MRVKIEVFTSPTCPHCPSAVRLAKSIEKRIPDIVKAVETSSGSQHGYQRFKKFNVMATPTIIISGPAIQDKIGFVGTPSERKLVKAISEASGINEREIMNKLEGNIEEPTDTGVSKLEENGQSAVSTEDAKLEEKPKSESGIKKIFNKFLRAIRKRGD